MSDWNGAGRTNYFRVEDRKGLEESLQDISIHIQEHPNLSGYVALFSASDEGGFPSTVMGEDWGEEVDFSFERFVMPFVAEGEVVVTQEVGHEGSKYVSASASAYVRHGDEIKSTHISLNDIHAQAAQVFGMDPEDISNCTYSTLHKSAQQQVDQMRSPKPAG